MHLCCANSFNVVLLSSLHLYFLLIVCCSPLFINVANHWTGLAHRLRSQHSILHVGVRVPVLEHCFEKLAVPPVCPKST
jgi:hypothetical protein